VCQRKGELERVALSAIEPQIIGLVCRKRPINIRSYMYCACKRKSEVERVAERETVLQCVAVCCSVLQSGRESCRARDFLQGRKSERLIGLF